jgi:hypothetical protein
VSSGAPTAPAGTAPVSTETKLEKAARKADEAVKTFDDFIAGLPFKLGGGAYLWYYQPTQGRGAKNKFELYAGYITFDANWDETVGIHFEPRFRDTKLRPFFQSNFWVQEIYAYANTPIGTVKAGKEYQHLGFFWDDSFYGNMPYFDGMKLNPNYGFSLEGSTCDWKWLDGSKDSPVALEYDLAYFINDGSTEGALDQRDVLSYNARKRDIVSGRLAPSVKFGDVKFTAGGFAEYWRADFPSAFEDNHVTSFGGDARLEIGPFAVYGEWAHRKGMTAPDFPDKGDLDKHKQYVTGGAKVDVWKFTFRLDASWVRYEDVGVEETLFVPQVTVQLHKHVTLLFEYAYWWRHQPHNQPHSDFVLQDNSLNFVLIVSF